MTPMSEPPTNAELGRRMDLLSEQIQALIVEIRSDRAIVDNTYVRKDVWSAQHEALKRDIREVADDLEDQKKMQQDKEKSWRNLRNQMIGGLILLAIPSLVSALIAINGFVAGR